MKQTACLALAVATVLIWSCSVPSGRHPSNGRAPMDDFQVLIDSMVNDRKTWMDGTF